MSSFGIISLLHSPVIFNDVRYDSILFVCLLFPLCLPSPLFFCVSYVMRVHYTFIVSLFCFALVLYGFPWLVLHCRSTPIILVV
jgi:hypothetical protein